MKATPTPPEQPSAPPEPEEEMPGTPVSGTQAEAAAAPPAAEPPKEPTAKKTRVTVAAIRANISEELEALEQQDKALVDQINKLSGDRAGIAASLASMKALAEKCGADD